MLMKSIIWLLRKELLAAFTMTIITVLFAVGTRSIEGEAAVVPTLLLYVMAFINVLQYILAVDKYRNDVDVFCLCQRYPIGLVGKQFAISLAYVLCLLPLGFYISSFLYLFLGSLVADPNPIAVRSAAIRGACSFAFVFFLWVLFSYSLGVVIPSFSLF